MLSQKVVLPQMIKLLKEIKSVTPQIHAIKSTDIKQLQVNVVAVPLILLKIDKPASRILHSQRVLKMLLPIAKRGILTLISSVFHVTKEPLTPLPTTKFLTIKVIPGRNVSKKSKL